MRAILLSVIAMLVAGPPVAAAHDAVLPAHRRHGLLINEPWVMKHWSPFDEATLATALKLPQPQLEAFLYDDHHTLAQLAAQRGVAFEPLVDTLAAWTADVPAADPVVIKQRIRLMLVGGHLSQHVLFHVFHGAAFQPALIKATKLPLQDFNNKRAQLWSFRSLITKAGNDAAASQRGVADGIRSRAAQGVANAEEPQSQSDRMAQRQLGRLPCWFARPAQQYDPAAPYDRRYTKGDPKHTSDDVPTTRAAQAKEERLISRGLAGRPHACWDLPQQFRGNTGKPLTRKQLRALAQLPTGFHGAVNDAHAMHEMQH